MQTRFPANERGGFFRPSFFKDERGQDLVEYSLILAFVALAGAAAYIGMSASTNGLWTVVNSRLASANQGGS
jgi:Flp pilus assembly pilin Flp